MSKKNHTIFSVVINVQKKKKCLETHTYTNLSSYFIFSRVNNCEGNSYGVCLRYGHCWLPLVLIIIPRRKQYNLHFIAENYETQRG